MAEGQEFSHAYVEHIASLSHLHYMSIPDVVMLKQGPLKLEERLVIDPHVELGLTMVDMVLHQHALLDQPGV